MVSLGRFQQLSVDFILKNNDSWDIKIFLTNWLKFKIPLSDGIVPVNNVILEQLELHNPPLSPSCSLSLSLLSLSLSLSLSLFCKGTKPQRVWSSS